VTEIHCWTADRLRPFAFFRVTKAKNFELRTSGDWRIKVKPHWLHPVWQRPF
jgi:hypothetical protein